MKLLSLRFIGGNPPIPGFRELGVGPFLDWSAMIDGAKVLIVSPAGWQRGSTVRLSSGERRVFEIDRRECVIEWAYASDEPLKASQAYEPVEEAPRRGPGRPRKVEAEA